MNLSNASPPGTAAATGAVPRLPLTIFAIPKPFRSGTAVIQRNALASWTRLRPAVNILLFGDEEGIAAAAAEFACQHLPQLARNEFGTPLVSDAFARAAQTGAGGYLAYCNADLILLPDFLQAIERLIESQLDRFLAIGRRTNLDLTEQLDWTDPAAVARLHDRVAHGELESLMCKDYFVFPRGLFSQLPEFAVGRGNWDSWLVQTAKAQRIPVIDLSPCTRVVHQNHGHEHVPGGRAAGYWRGPEARQNQRAGGGKYWIRGSTADWELTPAELRRKAWPGLHLPFWKELPSALRLAWRIVRPAGPRA